MKRNQHKANARNGQRLENDGEIPRVTTKNIVNLCHVLDLEIGLFAKTPYEWAASMKATLKRVDYGVLVVMAYIFRWYLPNQIEGAVGQIRFKGDILLISTQTIARETHLSARQVSRNLNMLQQLELIRMRLVEGKGYEVEPNIANLWRLCEGKPLEKNPSFPAEWIDYDGDVQHLPKLKPVTKVTVKVVPKESIKPVDFQSVRPT